MHDSQSPGRAQRSAWLERGLARPLGTNVLRALGPRALSLEHLPGTPNSWAEVKQRQAPGNPNILAIAPFQMELLVLTREGEEEEGAESAGPGLQLRGQSSFCPGYVLLPCGT